MNHYPAIWKEIAKKIKDLANGKCEICGSPSIKGRVLTVHHLNQNKADCEYKNLVALCQVCHLRLQGRGFSYDQMYLFGPPEWVKKRE